MPSSSCTGTPAKLINNNYNRNKTNIYFLYLDILVAVAVLYARAEKLKATLVTLHTNQGDTVGRTQGEVASNPAECSLSIRLYLKIWILTALHQLSLEGH